MLWDLIRRLADGHVMLDMVAELEDRDEFEQKLTSARPDLVLIGLRGDESDEVVVPVLTCLPAAKFIVFSSDGRQASGYELQLQRTKLADLSPQGLINFISGPAWPTRI